MLVENEMEAIAKGDDIAERHVLVPAEREDPERQAAEQQEWPPARPQAAWTWHAGPGRCPRPSLGRIGRYPLLNAVHRRGLPRMRHIITTHLAAAVAKSWCGHLQALVRGDGEK